MEYNHELSTQLNQYEHLFYFNSGHCLLLGQEEGRSKPATGTGMGLSFSTQKKRSLQYTAQYITGFPQKQVI